MYRCFRLKAVAERTVSSDRSTGASRMVTCGASFPRLPGAVLGAAKQELIDQTGGVYRIASPVPITPFVSMR